MAFSFWVQVLAIEFIATSESALRCTGRRWKRRTKMKTFTKLAIGAARAKAAALAPAPAADAHVSVGIGVGVPGPVYGGYGYAPYPAYYGGCNPYYYNCGY